MTDYLIVGAGPAGMSAALTAVDLGIKPDIADNRPEPGGNIFAFLDSTRRLRTDSLDLLGPAYRDGVPLIDRFLDAVSKDKIRYWPSSKVWHLDREHSYSISGPDRNFSGKAKKICLATGAQERPMPLPGWTLPGVMGVGAAQITLKAGGALPPGPIVIIGTGPLPLLLAKQLRSFEQSVVGIVEPKGSRKLLLSPLAYLGSLASPITALKGVSYLISQQVSGTPVYSEVVEIEIAGKDCATQVCFSKNGERVEIDAGLVLIHDGIIPNANPIGASGVETDYDEIQQTYKVSGKDEIIVAGDAAGILGAQAAEITGRIAALRAFDQPVPPCLKFGLWRQRKFRRFLDEAYPPVKLAVHAPKETLICRCELSNAGQIRNVINITGPDANRIKTTLRCGMGPCQGRLCGSSIVDLIHSELGTPYSDITPQRYRSPILPVSFRELASNHPND